MKKVISLILVLTMLCSVFLSVPFSLPVSAVEAEIVFEGTYDEFIERKMYLSDWANELMDYTPPASYAYLDIDQDGTDELIISSDIVSEWTYIQVYTHNSATNAISRIPFSYSVDGFSCTYASVFRGIRYSDTYKALVYTSLNNGSVFGDLGYDSINNGVFECVFSIGWDTDGKGWGTDTEGRTYYAKGELISEEEYYAHLDELTDISFLPISEYVPGTYETANGQGKGYYGISLYIPVVESRLDKYNYDDLTVEDQQKCRGLLYDLNGDNTVELILRLKDEYSFSYEVWSIADEKAVCVNEPFFWGSWSRMWLSHLEGHKALVYQDLFTGSGAAGEIITVYTFDEIPYKESCTLEYANNFDIDTPDEIGDYYSINGSTVSKNEYEKQLSIVTDGIELFVAETQYEGLSLSELLNYLNKEIILTSQDYAREKWIKQHIEYAVSDAYSEEIISGFDPLTLSMFRDALNDGDVESFEARKRLVSYLNLDVEISESEMFEFLIAEILYGEAGGQATEKIYNQNLYRELEKYAKMFADSAQQINATKKLPADVKKNLLDLYELLQTLEKGSPEYSNTLSTFFSQINENAGSLVDNWKTDLLGDATFAGVGIIINGAFEQYDALEDIAYYLANYAAYKTTSQQTQEVLMRLSVNVFINYDGIYGVDQLISELGLESAWVNWSDFQTALVSVLDSLEMSEQDIALAVAEFAANRQIEANEKFTTKATTTVSVFVVEKLLGCVPIMKTILLAKDLLSAGVSATIYFDMVSSNVDEREYALDMLIKTYCISVMLDYTVEDCAESMNEKDFNSTLVFDEAVSIYKRNLLLASNYATLYSTLSLQDALSDLELYDSGDFIDRLFKNRDKLVQAVTDYSNSLKLLEEQREKILAISCHDSALQYNTESQEIINNFQDSRIHVVACPVDVIVKTDAGEQIAYLSGTKNEISSGYEFYFHTVKLSDESDEYLKVAIVPDNYQIELLGTGDGMMNVFVTDFSTESTGAVETYFGIPVEKDSVGYFEYNPNSENADNLIMDQASYSNMEDISDISAALTDSFSRTLFLILFILFYIFVA